MKLSISLNKPKTTQPAPLIRPPSAFSLGTEDPIDEDGLPGPVAHNVESSKAMRKRMDAEKRVDATVFKYDEVWDRMQEAKQRQQAAKDADANVRKVF